MAHPPRLPADLLLLGATGVAAAANAAPPGPLPLAKLSIQWHGSAALGWGGGARGEGPAAQASARALPLHNLRKLAFPGGTRLWVDGSLPPAQGTLGRGAWPPQGWGATPLPGLAGLSNELRTLNCNAARHTAALRAVSSCNPSQPATPHPPRAASCLPPLWRVGPLPPAELPNLTDFGLIDGLLVGDLDACWLPPSVTMLALAAVGLTRLPGVLAHLPRLQR